MSRIEIHIEELVLHGFDGARGAEIGQAAENELVRLIRANGMPGEWHPGATVEHVVGDRIELRPDADAGTVGGRIAQSVYGGLQR